MSITKSGLQQNVKRCSILLFYDEADFLRQTIPSSGRWLSLIHTNLALVHWACASHRVNDRLLSPLLSNIYITVHKPAQSYLWIHRSQTPRDSTFLQLEPDTGGWGEFGRELLRVGLMAARTICNCNFSGDLKHENYLLNLKDPLPHLSTHFPPLLKLRHVFSRTRASIIHTNAPQWPRLVDHDVPPIGPWNGRHQNNSCSAQCFISRACDFC